MDVTTIILLILIGACCLGLVALGAMMVFKKYKGKDTLSFDEIMGLLSDLSNLAEMTTEYIKVFTKDRYDFESDADYRSYLVDELIKDFDDFIFKLFPETEEIRDKYFNLSDESKRTLVNTILNMIPVDKMTRSTHKDPDAVEGTTEDITSENASHE